jgi:hypothetical protein
MLGQRKRLNTEQAERDAAPARRLLRIERDLREQLRKLHDQLAETKRDLHLDAESIQSVVETGLALAGQPPLQEVAVPGIWPDPTRVRSRCPVFALPPLSGSWRLAADGLAHPHTGEIRPIVFDHTLSVGRDDVVLAHLNHRLVQMCLQLLRAEVWAVAGVRKLHRITARVIPNSSADVPVAIAHARLVVLGADNKRLHEELIFAGGELREGRFTRIQQVGRLEQLLAAATARPVSATMQERLRTLWPEHRGNLLRSLEARSDDRTKTLQSRLDDRAEREIRSMRAVLGELGASIKAQLSAIDPQLELFSIPEKEQFERDRGALERRLAELPQEMELEAQIIRAPP